MSDDDGNAGQPSKHSAPQVGAEHVRVDDVGVLGAQQCDETPERPDVKSSAPLESDVPHACREHSVQQRAVA